MFVVKILGILDIFAALVIFTDIGAWFLAVPLFIVYLIKGLSSLAADIVGKFYGVIDLITGFIILSGLNLPGIIEALLIIVLLFKGVTSLL